MNTKEVIANPCILILFRFLYGRWIHNATIWTVLANIGSDSSMVDEYADPADYEKITSLVQIPLWSMNTPGYIDAYPP